VSSSIPARHARNPRCRRSRVQSPSRHATGSAVADLQHQPHVPRDRRSTAAMRLGRSTHPSAARRATHPFTAAWSIAGTRCLKHQARHPIHDRERHAARQRVEARLAPLCVLHQLQLPHQTQVMADPRSVNIQRGREARNFGGSSREAAQKFNPLPREALAELPGGPPRIWLLRHGWCDPAITARRAPPQQAGTNRERLTRACGQTRQGLRGDTREAARLSWSRSGTCAHPHTCQAPESLLSTR
jgi:hypothetical protein